MILLKILRVFNRLTKINSITKYIIGKKISKISKKKVVSGIYKNTYVSSDSRWGKTDYANKLLGLYEFQIQQKIFQIKKKFNLYNIINFGAADGYHLVGLLKNNIFKNGIAFEKDSRERINLLNNLIKNKIKKKRFNILGDAKFLYKWNEDHSFLKRNVDIHDVGNSALYLLSELAKGVTGEIHYVDAGYNKVGMPDPKNII